MRGCLKGGCLNAKMLGWWACHSLRKVYRCVMSLPWESWWSMNAIRFVFCDWTKIAALISCFNDATQEILVSVVICLNFVVIIIEANYGAECDGNMTSHASMLIPPNLAAVETGWHLTLFQKNGCFQMREDARWLCTRVAICYQLLFCGVLHFGSFCSLAVGLADGEHAGKWWKQSNLRNQEIPKMGFLQNH